MFNIEYSGIFIEDRNNLRNFIVNIIFIYIRELEKKN